jgi:GMP synthase (glutamine-hydrolysing)
MSLVLGGKVERAANREYGKTKVYVDGEMNENGLFDGVPAETVVWMSHFDYISKLAPGFEVLAHTDNCPYAAAGNAGKKLYAIQFHPEVLHTEKGKEILFNFVRKICGCSGDWRMDSFVESTVKEIRAKVGNGRVLLALSGGVDSSVAAGLLSRAIGKQLTCVFVDHGLLRKNEGDEVEAVFGPKGKFDLNFIRVNAQQRYYNKLAGVSEPEKKRKIIGSLFIDVFAEEARKLEGVSFLAQGTIYPDILESEAGVKAHHNVGGLPEDLAARFELVEPVKLLYKDEVRMVGKALGLPDNMVYRQPFPGPGLGVRCVGAITRDRLEAVRESDAILREEFALAGLEGKVWQYFTVVPPFTSTGIKDGKRTDDWMVIIRAVNSVDATAATVPELPYGLLFKIRDRILAEVKGVNRVLYDLSGKPVATIEFE